MQYAELIQFESLETVIEIRDANDLAKAKQLVSTYMISNEMAERLIHLVFVQLQFDQRRDNKGLLIVGNYGTGKSHLMAVISSLAEHAELVSDLHHPQVAEVAQAIAGKFKVLRTEIGATMMSLRDMLTKELEDFLDNLGVHFRFPAADTITNNKRAFEEMMLAFETHYPEQGVLLVVDELLEYLRARTDQELILDLSFLREIGEVCKDLRFRFIAGLQETIFDNQRFEFVSNALRRVKDRFEQILITRQDIKFVVAERLLKKSDEQTAEIETYLRRFATRYANINERMAEFCSLFPVHPDYIDTFERITIIEKREILKTLERGVHALANTTVPENEPGLLAYDSYWHQIRENPSFRAIPEVREVIECSQVLENRIEQAFTRPNYKPMAIRIIHALSVHRLTTYDIAAPVGVTAQELRDGLCLYQTGIDELGGNPADDLLSLVETVLREILKTVNKQFISTNSENGQYYIDFKKNYDFDAIIEKRAESLDFHQLDRYYYAALRQVMEVSDIPSGWSQSFSWGYELEWRSHRVTRQGYLIFDIPGRNTKALSIRDDSFFLYFLPPFQLSVIRYQLSMVSAKNEVFFQLTKTDEQFDQLLRLYTAAADLVSTSSGHAKAVYESKAQTYLREVLKWLQEYKASAFEVTYQGETHQLIEWLEEVKHDDDFRVTSDPALFTPHPSLLDNFRDLIELVADNCLERYFSELAPEYPVFPILVSHDNLPALAQEALRSIANPNRSKPARGLLAALGLLNGDQIDPTRSKYALAILEQLQHKPAGQVLNQDELLSENYFAPNSYRLEPELVMVLISALVYAGDMVLVMQKQQFDASNFADLAVLTLKELLTFRHLERPKAFNRAALKALFEFLALPSGLDIALTHHDEIAVQQLQTKVSEIISQLIPALQMLETGFIFWGKPVLNQTDDYRESLTKTKTFLESLQAYSTPLKFKNFRYTAEEIMAHQIGLNHLQEISHLMAMLRELSQPIAYLTAAEAALPPEEAWVSEMNQLRDTLLSRLSDTEERHSTGLSYQIQQQLNNLQNAYIELYLDLHQQARLGKEEETAKQALLTDQRLLNLKKLARVEFLPRHQLSEFENSLNRLQSCYALTDNDLLAHTVCPYCGYKPLSEPKPSTTHTTRITRLDEILEQFYSDWTQTLLAELENATTQRELLKPESRAQLEAFLTERSLPENITEAFIEAIQESLSDLIKVTVQMADLQNALLAGGSPMTAIEMQKRFIHYLNSVTQDKALNLVRIVLE
ncbi:MAG TPA: ATP-binding protein [Thiotrichaceae bacterium]|nr:ATP-binding protein [Thiotrichaceae bacterium]